MTRREILQFDLPALSAQRDKNSTHAQRENGATARASRWFGRKPGKPHVKTRAQAINLKGRLYVVLMVLALGSTALIVRAVDLQWVRKDFYQDQGEQRYVRELPIDAPRGTIYDRNGEPLAVSTPVESIWADPSTLVEHTDRIPELAKALGLDAEALNQKLNQKADKQFVYLTRHLNPDDAAAILKLGIPGVYSRREFRRFYPNGEVTAHILGKTNVDDQGQEGLELAFDEYLAGKPGSKSVIRDLHGHAVESVDVDLDTPPKPGHDLTLSIDKNLQYLAYRELMSAIKEHHASTGSIVVLDSTNGEILAMVNQPSFNPNSQNGGNIPAADLLSHMRNRAVTDVVEPGSTMKAVTISAALESGKWRPDSKVDTSPGTYTLYDGRVIHDTANHGVLTVTGVITHSSNIGAAKIAATLPRDAMYDMFQRFGLGETTGSGFTGESPGNLPIAKRWGPVEQATISYGYGLSVTPLQLARAYAALADGGILHQPTFVKDGGDAGKRIVDAKIASEVVAMLRTVVAPDSTAPLAAVPNYFAGGKTGTSRIAARGGYNSYYNSLFVGFVPATDPRLVTAVVISGSSGNDIRQYAGGTVAAPSFSKVMQGALRLLDVPPDNVKNWYVGGPGPNPQALPPAPPQIDPNAPAGEGGRGGSVAMTSRLADLLEGIASDDALEQGRDIVVRGLALDSRRVRVGDAFFALQGGAAHGITFAPDAVAQGAAVVLAERPAVLGPQHSTQAAPVVWIDNLRAQVGEIAARFFDRPSETLHVIGVTGTNGKTSIVQLLAAALLSFGSRTATIGTLGAGLVGAIREGERTTPDAVSVQALLAEFRDAGASHVAMEVSSHALEQGRVNALAFEVAAFTNLTRDHLDYHATMEAYGAAKARLFTWPGLRAAVINIDDAFGRELVGVLPANVRGLRYGVENTQADIVASEVRSSTEGLHFTLSTPWGEGAVSSVLLGRFNVANLLAVAGCLGALGYTFAQIHQVLESAQPVIGRMNRLGGGAAPLIVVDYAHTPDALEQALTSLRAHCACKLICVFGCGGERDQGKRPQMAAIAERFADRVIVTDDNPRGENGDAIVAQILAGFAKPQAATVQRDRAQAIALALREAQPGDVVLIAGKGHEPYQEIAGIKHPFDDLDVARRSLEARAC